MTIEPKFKINDLVQHKFQKQATLKGQGTTDYSKQAKFFEILYIKTETCSAGTQIFYQCRCHFPIAENSYKEDQKLIDIFPSAGRDSLEGTINFREDELKVMNDEDKTFYGLIG